MEWYHYFSAFWAGMFVANFVPHYVHGVGGNKFPTPWAKPGGIGLSSSMVNMLWGLFNLLAGCLLLWMGNVHFGNIWSLATVFIGFTCMSLFAANHFQRKHKE